MNAYHGINGSARIAQRLDASNTALRPGDRPGVQLPDLTAHQYRARHPIGQILHTVIALISKDHGKPVIQCRRNDSLRFGRLRTIIGAVGFDTFNDGIAQIILVREGDFVTSSERGRQLDYNSAKAKGAKVAHFTALKDGQSQR